jgi:hypothetical protein
MSGTFITTHKAFVDESAPKLSAASQTDTTLQAHTAAAAALTQAGAQRLDTIAAQTRETSQAAATVSTPAGEKAVLVALRSQLARANDVVSTTKQQAAGLAGQVRSLKYPPASSGHGDTQALGFGPGGAPQNPPPQDPPHGKDPRYWIDVTKIIHVPDGQLAPYGTTQIGPGLYYPTGTPYQSTPPPPPAQFPVDASTIMYYPPGGPLPPYGTTELAPGYYTYAPPGAGSMIPPSYTPDWAPPQQPIDVRDVLHVPHGTLAPWGYVQYLPEWFMPGPELTNTPDCRDAMKTSE